MAIISKLEWLLQIPVYLAPNGERWAKPWWSLHPARWRFMTRRWSGEWKGTPIRVLTVGRVKDSADWCEDFLGELEFEGGEFRPFLSAAEMAAQDFDLTVVEICPREVQAFRDAGFLVAPVWMRWCADVEQWFQWRAGLDEIRARRSRGLRSDLRKVEQQAYEFERGGSRQDWHEFWVELAEPYARTQFGEWATQSSWLIRFVHTQFSRLHFIRRADRRVAGVATLTWGPRAWLEVLGALPDPELRRQGVIVAIYCLAFEWARSEGIRHLDFGRSENWVNEGVGRYKEKWGLAPTLDAMSQLLAFRPGPKLRDAFVEEPLRVWTERGLEIFRG